MNKYNNNRDLVVIFSDNNPQLLYLPRTILQLGHLCFTFFRLSTQRGMQKQGQSMVRQRVTLNPQASMLGEELVCVVTLIWQLGHTILTGWHPKSMAGTCTTLTTCGGGHCEVGGGGAHHPPGVFTVSS